MAISIREVDLKGDRGEIITFLRQNLTPHSNGLRFNWLYLENPFGQARAWIAMNESGETVGLGAAFPRFVWVDGKPRRGWVLGDLCIAPSSRSLGPALLLQRQCLKSLAIDESPVWFDFPSRSMMAVYRRLGVPTAGNHVRYVKLFRIDKMMERHIPVRSVARGVSWLGNLALKVRLARFHLPPSIELSQHEGAFQEEFTALDSTAAHTRTIRGRRTAEYLNWRYRQNPFNQYRVAVARRGGELLGYAVLEMTGSNWILTDLHAIEEGNTIPCILAYLDHLAKTSNLDSISIPTMEGSTLVQYLRRAGFHRREAIPIVARAGDVPARPMLPNAQNWFLMHGDRES